MSTDWEYKLERKQKVAHKRERREKKEKGREYDLPQNILRKMKWDG